MTRHHLLRLTEGIDRRGPDECWPWTRGKSKGYGVLKVDGVARKVHVLVLEEQTGEPAAGRYGLHSCDNKPCCNPSHLRWGTPVDNVQDMDTRGRRVVLSGERHSMARLTEEQVLEIRQRYGLRRKGSTLADLGREFGVHLSTVHLIVTRKKWAHV